MLSCGLIHLTTLHFPCCCSVISSIFYCFLDLYTKFFATESYALFDDCIILFLHLQIPSVRARREKKKILGRKKNLSTDWLICYSKEDIKQKNIYFCYYNSQSASAAVLSFKLPTTTTYNIYFTRKNWAQEWSSIYCNWNLRILLETTQVWLKVKI